jgi:hypothetical protein
MHHFVWYYVAKERKAKCKLLFLLPACLRIVGIFGGSNWPITGSRETPVTSAQTFLLVRYAHLEQAGSPFSVHEVEIVVAAEPV